MKRRDTKKAIARLNQDVVQQSAAQLPARIEFIQVVDETRPRRVEIVRSYAHKINIGRFDQRRQYETIDIFCSQKTDCQPEEAAEVSQALFMFSRAQVLQGAREEVQAIIANKHKRESNPQPGGLQD